MIIVTKCSKVYISKMTGCAGEKPVFTYFNAVKTYRIQNIKCTFMI